MQGLSILKNLFDNLIDTGIVRNVYHSVVIRQDGDHKKPAAPVSDRFQYVGVDDSKRFTTYCRAIGAMEVVKEEKFASCGGKNIRVQILHRLVFFNQKESRDFDDISGKLINAVLKTGNKIKFQRLVTNYQDILLQEAPTGQFKFTPSTYYTAIEFFVILDLTTNNCQQEIRCSGIENPYCFEKPRLGDFSNDHNEDLYI